MAYKDDFVKLAGGTMYWGDKWFLRIIPIAQLQPEFDSSKCICDQ